MAEVAEGERAGEGGSRAGVDDAIGAEILRNALRVAVEEAATVVVRAAHSTNIQEGADAAAALLDATGRLLAQADSTSLLHSASLRTTLPHVIAEIGLGRMRPGDVYCCNDPYRGGIHANDILVFRPIFAGGAVAYVAGTLVHVADLGGSVAGGLAALATDTFAEGILLPPVCLVREGHPQRDVFAILERNSRAPGKVVGDVGALVAGANVLARRVDELLEQYGAGELARRVEDQLRYARRRLSEELAAFPDGTWRGGFRIDTDGIDPSRSLEVAAEVTVRDRSVRVDLRGTSPQSAGSINSSESQTLSAVVYAVRCFLDPSIPMNEACFEVIEADLPYGTLVNPRPPAACGGRVTTVVAVIDAILEALSQARPEQAVAPGALIHVFTLAGADPSGTPWLNLFYEFGGIGARRGCDGPDATGSFFFGGRSVIPQVEPIESQYPLVVEHCGLRVDSGGPGQWRGGLGATMSIRALGDAELTVRGDRMLVPPPGAFGGQPGRAGRYRVLRRDGAHEQLAPRQQGVRLAPGDVFSLEASGGGGLGDPSQRDRAAVRRDVAEGRVSSLGAARDYGLEDPGSGPAAGGP